MSVKRDRLVWVCPYMRRLVKPAWPLDRTHVDPSASHKRTHVQPSMAVSKPQNSKTRHFSQRTLIVPRILHIKDTLAVELIIARMIHCFQSSPDAITL